MTKEEQAVELREKVSLTKLEELTEKLHNLQSIHLSAQESLTQKVTTLREDFEAKTAEMRDQIEDLNKKLDDIENEGSEDYDDESD